MVCTIRCDFLKFQNRIVLQICRLEFHEKNPLRCYCIHGLLGFLDTHTVIIFVTMNGFFIPPPFWINLMVL